eukprot:gene5749-6654_t
MMIKIIIVALLALTTIVSAQPTTTTIYVAPGTNAAQLSNTASSCGATSSNPCPSMQMALTSFVNAHPNWSGTYPPLVLLLARGVYSGNDNTNLNVYGFDVTIKPSSTTGQVIFKLSTPSSLFTVSEMFVTQPADPANTHTSVTMQDIITQNTNSMDGSVISVEVGTSSFEGLYERCTFANGVGGSGCVAGLTNLGDSSIVLSVYNSSVANMSCSQGGAFYLLGANLYVFNSNFTNLEAVGGAIYAEDANVQIENCLFQDCSSPTVGGAIYAEESNISIQTNSRFSGNTAPTNGGALYYSTNPNNFKAFIPDMINIGNTVFDSNTAGQQGGDIYLSALQRLSLYISQSSFSNSKGGSIYASTTSLTLMDSDFSGSQGGFVWLNNTGAYMSNVSMLDGSSTNGGAVYMDSVSSLTITGSLVSNNQATDGGSIFCQGSSQVTVTATKFINNFDKSGLVDGFYCAATSPCTFEIDSTVQPVC